jgi:hypothetical protein
MVSDLDIYRAATLVIQRHGAEAAQMIDRMLANDDAEAGSLAAYQLAFPS